MMPDGQAYLGIRISHWIQLPLCLVSTSGLDRIGISLITHGDVGQMGTLLDEE